ncbi:MAG: hypothetical protein Kow00121_63170 [Elainellaceae cyanobacterium]
MIGLASGLNGCQLFQPEQSLLNSSAAISPSTSEVEQARLQICPRQFSEWTLKRSFETARYTLALCQQDDSLYLVGYEKQQPEVQIAAPARVEDETIWAESADRLSYEIRQNTLTIRENGTIIGQEGID